MRLSAIMTLSFIVGSAALGAIEAARAARVSQREIGDCRTVVPITRAVAALEPAKKQFASGIVYFKQEENGVRIVGTFHGLPPGKHGFHIHEFGDCSDHSGASIGKHYNPTHSKHGGPDHLERHVGDLGNVVADDYGFARYERLDHLIQLNGPNSIIGKSLAVSNCPDDFCTQPTGNSGGITCFGLICER